MLKVMEHELKKIAHGCHTVICEEHQDFTRQVLDRTDAILTFYLYIYNYLNNHLTIP